MKACLLFASLFILLQHSLCFAFTQTIGLWDLPKNDPDGLSVEITVYKFQRDPGLDNSNSTSSFGLTILAPYQRECLNRQLKEVEDILKEIKTNPILVKLRQPPPGEILRFFFPTKVVVSLNDRLDQLEADNKNVSERISFRSVSYEVSDTRIFIHAIVLNKTDCRVVTAQALKKEIEEKAAERMLYVKVYTAPAYIKEEVEEAKAKALREQNVHFWGTQDLRVYLMTKSLLGGFR